MRNLSATAQRMRMINQAHGKFLGRFAAECIFEQEKPLDRALRAIENLPHPGSESDSFEKNMSNDS